jgi:hypothetical protein
MMNGFVSTTPFQSSKSSPASLNRVSIDASAEEPARRRHNQNYGLL